MQTDALALARQSMELAQSERLSWGVVELQVSDLDRAVTFWTTALGVTLRDKDVQYGAASTLHSSRLVSQTASQVCPSASFNCMS